MKVGITFSCFDLFHAGHVLMLEEAKAQCDYLIAGLQVDPSMCRHEKNKPVQSLYERWVQLAACKYVDKIIPYVEEQEIIDILASQNVDVRIIGEEYKDAPFTGRGMNGISGKAIQLYYNSRRHGFSTTELRNRIKGI